MNNIFTSEGIQELLEVLKQYIIYVYPGFITLVIYRFAMLKNIEENKNTFIKSIIISYLYTIPFQINKINPIDFEFKHHILIIIFAVLIPLIWNLIIRSDTFKKVIRFFKIKTEIYDNTMDIMFYKENGIVWVRAYMDEQKIMYEGSLRHYESDTNKEQQIILSGYRFYNYNTITQKYDLLVYDYSTNQKEWVRLLEKNITRMEFIYKKDH